MTLATSKDTKAGPSLVPVSGSPSSLESQNLSSNQRAVDKAKKEGDDRSDTSQEERISALAQHLGEHESDAPGEDDPSHSDVPVSPTGAHPKLAGSTTSRSTTMTNGADTSGKSAWTTEQTQTPSTRTAVSLQRETQPVIQEPVNGLDSFPHLVQPNGRAKPTPDPSSSISTSSTNGPPHVTDNPSCRSKDVSVTPIASETMSVEVNDDEEPPSKRTRSRQKRPPDSMSKEPAKRARTSVDASPGAAKSLESTSKTKGSDNGNVKMRDGVLSSVEPPNTRTKGLGPSQPPTITDTQVTNSDMDSNLDPALALVSGPQRPQSDSSTTPAAPYKVQDQSPNGEAKSSPSSPSSEQAKPDSLTSSSLANNPYLGLSTAFLKGSTNSGGAGFNPYTLYYGPGTPMSPHTPTYPYPYFYHLPSPIAAQVMYPASPSFPSSPTIQKLPPISIPGNGEPQRQKPKRLKAHTVTSGNHNIPIVPRDKKGKPMLPLNVGIMTVIRLGDVCTREHFHTERYIFPVGYEVTRRYLSTVDPNSEVVYHCTILDGGDGPKFQIVPSDAPDRTVIAGTATGAWSNIVKQANTIRSRQHSNSVSGPDFFGLGQNTIKHLIQELPNADRLRDYVWQNFIEGGPLGGRHAAVTPALPEDYDSTLPIGALYPSERDRLKQEASSSPRGLNHYPQHIIAQAEAQRKQQTAVQGSQQHDTPIDPSLPTSSASTNGYGIPSNQPPMDTGSTTPQPVPPIPLSTTDAPSNSQPSSSSVPTTIAGIMSAYPVPVPPTQASPPAASASAPSASS